MSLPITIGALVHWPFDPRDIGVVGRANLFKAGDFSVEWANHSDAIDADGYILCADGTRLQRGPRGRFIGPVRVVR